MFPQSAVYFSNSVQNQAGADPCTGCMSFDSNGNEVENIVIVAKNEIRSIKGCHPDLNQSFLSHFGQKKFQTQTIRLDLEIDNMSIKLKRSTDVEMHEEPSSLVAFRSIIKMFSNCALGRTHREIPRRTIWWWLICSAVCKVVILRTKIFIITIEIGFSLTERNPKSPHRRSRVDEAHTK